jgi:hypothetical protein
LTGTTQRLSAASHRVHCFAFHIADIGRAAVRLHPEQLLEVDRLALGFELRGALLGRLHQGVLR